MAKLRADRQWRRSVYLAAAAVGLDRMQAEFVILRNLLRGVCGTSAAALAPNHSDGHARQAVRALESWGLVCRRVEPLRRGRGRVSVIQIDPSGVIRYRDRISVSEAAELLFELKPNSGGKDVTRPTEHLTEYPPVDLTEHLTEHPPEDLTEHPTEVHSHICSLDNKELHGPRSVERGDVDHLDSVVSRPVAEPPKPQPRPVAPARPFVVMSREQCEDTAAKIFQRCRYTGCDGQSFWKAAAACKAELIPEAALSSAVNAVVTCSPRNAPAYFRTVLAEQMGTDLKGLSELLAGVRITPNLPGEPPQRRSQEPVFRSVPQAETKRDSDAAMARRQSELVRGFASAGGGSPVRSIREV